MKIGIIGPGNVGGPLGKIWADAGHEVFFSFGRDEEKLKRIAAETGANAQSGRVADACAFGNVIVLSVPWGAVDAALSQAGNRAFDGKILWSTVNALLPDFSGLAIGTTTSAAEYIAGKVPGATVVEALPVNAPILSSPSRLFGQNTPTVFVTGDDGAAKATVTTLLADAGMEGVDAGPLQNARLAEPAGLLVAQLGYLIGLNGNVAVQLLRRKRSA